MRAIEDEERVGSEKRKIRALQELNADDKLAKEPKEEKLDDVTKEPKEDLTKEPKEDLKEEKAPKVDPVVVDDGALTDVDVT